MLTASILCSFVVNLILLLLLLLLLLLVLLLFLGWIYVFFGGLLFSLSNVLDVLLIA